MPEMDGFEATRQIRSGQSGVLNPSIPIIALTARVLEGDREKCLAAGMNDYLVKPLEPESLAQALDRWGKRLPDAPPAGPATLTKTSGHSTAGSPKLPTTGFPIMNGSVVFDRAGLLRRLMGDTQLARAVTQSFLKEMPFRLKELVEAVNHQNAALTQAIAHQIKGASAAAGGIPLARLAAEIEAAAHQEDLEQLNDLTIRLEDQFFAVKELITQELWDNEGIKTPTNGSQ